MVHFQAIIMEKSGYCAFFQASDALFQRDFLVSVNWNIFTPLSAKLPLQSIKLQTAAILTEFFIWYTVLSTICKQYIKPADLNKGEIYFIN